MPGEPSCEGQTGGGSTLWSTRLKDLEREAFELARLVENRKRTIVLVASHIVEKQAAYLDGDTEHKKPLTVSQIAAQLSMPVSTVSRAIKNMTISTPRGTTPLRELLSRPVPVEDGPDVSSDYILTRIAEFARLPDGKSRSDLEISNMLRSEGIEMARRTVNKYRRQGIH
jgi:RNA polymerase sigma-54 factor